MLSIVNRRDPDLRGHLPHLDLDLDAVLLLEGDLADEFPAVLLDDRVGREDRCEAEEEQQRSLESEALRAAMARASLRAEDEQRFAEGLPPLTF